MRYSAYDAMSTKYSETAEHDECKVKNLSVHETDREGDAPWFRQCEWRSWFRGRMRKYMHLDFPRKQFGVERIIVISTSMNMSDFD